MYCFSLVPCAVILHIDRSHLFDGRPTYSSKSDFTAVYGVHIF